MKRIWIPAICLALLLGGSCKDSKKDVVLTKEVTFSKEGTLQLYKASTDSVLVNLQVEFAETEYETQTGLMYRKGMEDQQAMLFIFDTEEMKGFYMKNTQFPLDIIFLDKDKQVVNIAKDAQPFNQSTLRSEGPAQYVLEVNAGLSDKWGLSPGDKMEWSRD